MDPSLPADAPERLEKLLASQGGSPAPAAGPERLGRLAVMHGFISLRQLEDALAEQDRQACRGEPPERLGRILVRNGWLDETSLDSLLRKQAAAGPALPEFKRYELRRRLGEGAAAIVYEALDRQLVRPVAMKILKETPSLHEAARRRLRLEAQALARLSHPHVVAVYDFEEDAGRACVVMELMEGRSLRTVLAERTLKTRDLLELLERVAEGVQHAHEHGIVHRDLKPENILVAPSGHPKVADFGLARLAGPDPSHTAAGSRNGTPLYMAPEQVEGRNQDVTPRTDVYALGVMLYEILTGRPPFTAESLTEVFARILSEEPARPRLLDGKTDADLETIALKALEKDPARRYSTAREFAEDLRSYRSGEPIRARPLGLGRRSLRRLRKAPFRMGLGVGAVLALAAGIVLWAPGARDSRRTREETEAALRANRDLARVLLKGALGFRRLGENAQALQSLPRMEDSYRQAIQRAPGEAEPEYLMGRFLRAILRDDAALGFQERALSKDPSYPPALYERILLVSRRFRDQLHDERKRIARERTNPASVGPVPAAWWPTLGEIEQGSESFQRTRDRLMDDCERLEHRILETDGRVPSSWPLSEANVLAARGILAYTRGKLDEAIGLLQQAVAKDPLLEEAWETLAVAALESPAYSSEERERRVREAEQYCTEGIARDQGYLPLITARAEIRHFRGDDRMCRGEDPLPDFAAAEDDLTGALRLQVEELNLRRARGDVRTSRGLFRMSRGQDPRPDFAAAEADFDGVLRLRPQSGAGLRRRAAVRIYRAQYRDSLGEDPTAELDAAEKELLEAAERLPKDPAVRASIGLARLLRGARRFARGEDPDRDLATADAVLSEALRLVPYFGNAWRDRGRVRTLQGLAKASRGEDPKVHFSDAEDDFRQGIERAQKSSIGWLTSDSLLPWAPLAEVRFERGLFVLKSGGDPRVDWGAAEEDLERALRLNPKDAEALVLRGRLRLHGGLWRQGRGEAAPAAAEVRSALEDFAEALRINPLLESRVAPDRARARASSSEK